MKKIFLKFIFSILFIFFLFYNFNTVDTYACPKNDRGEYKCLAFRTPDTLVFRRDYHSTGEPIVDCYIPSTFEGHKIKRVRQPDYTTDEDIKRYPINSPNIIFEEGIEVIEDITFVNLSGTTSISLPKSLKAIGVDAFSNAPNLSRFILGGVTFNNRIEITNSTLPNLTSLGISSKYGGFKGLDQLHSIYIKKDDLQISPNFDIYKNPNLREFYFESASVTNDIPTLQRNPKLSTITMKVPNLINFKSEFDQPFRETAIREANISLEPVERKEGACNMYAPKLTTITGGMFYLCNNLTSVTINPNITQIYYDAFQGTGLKRFEIPYSDNQITIWNSNFYGTPIEEIIINNPNTVFSRTPFSFTSSFFGNTPNLRTIYFKSGDTLEWNNFRPNLFSKVDQFSGDDNTLNLKVYIDRTIPDDKNQLDTMIGNAVKWRELNDTLVSNNQIRDYLSGENCYMRDKQGNWVPLAKKPSAKLYPYLEYIGSNTLAIKRDALRDDSSLKSITIPCDWDGTPIYKIERGTSELYIDSVTNVTIENGIKNIGDYTFKNFRSLSTTSFPNTLITLGEFAFINSGITTINIESNNLTTIGNSSFRDCNSLNSVTINSPNLTTIGKSAFQASSLNAINIESNSLTSIGSYAFYQCENLKKLEIPYSRNTLTIEQYFIRESGITELIINAPNTIPSDRSLSGASNLQTLYLKSDDSLAFNNLPNLLFNGLNNSNLNVAIDRTIPKDATHLDTMVGGAVKWRQSNEQLGAEISQYLSGENCYMKNENGEWIQLFTIKIDDGNEFNTIIGVRVRKDTIPPEKLSITVPTSLAILVHAAHTPETEMTPVDVYIGGGYSNTPGEVSGNLKFLNSSTQNGEPVDCVINSVDVYKMGSTWTLDETTPSSAYHINMQVNGDALNKGVNPLNITLNKATGSSSEGYIYSTTTLVPVKIVIGGNRSEYTNNTTQSPQFNLNWKVSKL